MCVSFVYFVLLGFILIATLVIFFRPFLHTQDMYFVFVQLLSSGSAWFAIIIIVVACLFLDVMKKVLFRHLQPTNTEKAQVIFFFFIYNIYNNVLF